MADSGFDQLRMEAENTQNQIPPIDNVHEAQAPPPQFAEPIDTLIPDATVCIALKGNFLARR